MNATDWPVIGMAFMIGLGLHLAEYVVFATKKDLCGLTPPDLRDRAAAGRVRRPLREGQRSLMDILTIAQNYGPLAGAVAWFMLRDHRREDRLTTRIETLEAEMRETLIPLVKEATAVITRNTEALERFEQLVRENRN